MNNTKCCDNVQVTATADVGTMMKNRAEAAAKDRKQKIRSCLDHIYHTSSGILSENFGNAVLEEIDARCKEDHLDASAITPKIVIEEMLQCYMSKMQ